MPHLTTLKAGPPWCITGASSLSGVAFRPSRLVQGGNPSLEASSSVGSGSVDIYRDWHIVHVSGGSGGVPTLLRLLFALPVIVSLIPPVERPSPLIAWTERIQGSGSCGTSPLQDVVNCLVGLHCIDGSLFQVLVDKGCSSFYDIFKDVARQAFQEHLLHLRVSGHVVCLTGQFFEL
jgi:hypothetical protein